jgi:hypothetical protein
LFFGGVTAWTVGDALYFPRAKSPFLAAVAGTLCAAGIAMVVVSVWIAIGAQFRGYRK